MLNFLDNMAPGVMIVGNYWSLGKFCQPGNLQLLWSKFGALPWGLLESNVYRWSLSAESLLSFMNLRNLLGTSYPYSLCSRKPIFSKTRDITALLPYI